MSTSVKPTGCTNFKLRQLGRVVTRHYDAYLAATGLKPTQYSLLSQVVRLEPIRPCDLAETMGMDASTLTRNLQPLAARGWLQQGPGHDARSRLIETTAEGRAKQTEAKRAWKQAQLSLNARLGERSVALLHAMIDDCIERLSGEPAEAGSKEAQ
jgi:DNA-binding MarR family transcriptional regulator